MVFGLISKKLSDERIADLKSQIVTLTNENHDLVNALAASRGAVAPFHAPNRKPMVPARARVGVFQMEKRLERLRRDTSQDETATGSGGS